ncbi:MAG: nucleoside 2-deoxyribosyltransferase [Lachnospiraceae bacterium]|nr:nucleoside 2-deoxyribosyltransferase [Lachnospiraceae bacterium]
MTKSAIIKQEIMTLLEDKENHSVQEMKEYLALQKIGDYTEGQFAGVVNNLQKNGLIRKMERGIYSLIEKTEDSQRKCFVISPIGDPGSDIRKNADQLFNHIIKPVCEKCGFKAIRIDHENTPDSITQEILDSLYNYDLVIADLTGHNPNVFFEIGYRTSTGKPIIHLKRKGEKIPFDVSSIRTFDYDLTDLDVVVETSERLEKAILSFAYVDDLDEPEEFEGGEGNKIISILNEVVYKLDVLSEDVRRKDQESIKAVVEAYNAIQTNESMETQMLKIVLPELLRNPKAADSLIKISEKFQK